MKFRSEKVYIILLNWNGWADTIECLESVFCNDYQNFRVIVCDNYSTDNSLEYIKLWANNRLSPWGVNKNKFRGFSSPPFTKHIPFIVYNRTESESGGRPDLDPPLIIIQTGKNLGFAGGNNVGIKYSLAREDFEYIWLLNNDTVIKPDALTALVNHMRSNSCVGICGSTLLDYYRPELVQAYGGAEYNKWLGTTHHIGARKSAFDFPSQSEINQKIKYIVGASMLVSKTFLEKVGLLSEDYFLFFEEIDWAIRSKGILKLEFEPNSIVYHKEGASIGSGSSDKNKSLIADYYGIRNRLLFTKKFYPLALPTVFLGVLFSILKRIRRKEWVRAKTVIKALLQIKFNTEKK